MEPVVKQKPRWRGRLHFGGFFLLWAASPILFVRAKNSVDVGWVLCYLFGVGAMMATSATFHLIPWRRKGYEIMKRLDHSGIFLAIAGSYLSIAGLTMHGRIRFVLFMLVAGGVVVGIGVRQVALHASKWANTIPYLIIGWVAVIFMPQIYRGGGPTCFALILLGGFAYSVGAAFYASKRPKLSPSVFSYHELFHACTLVGAGCIFAAAAVALR